MNGEGWGCGFNFQNSLGVCNLGIKTKTIPDIISANHKLRQCYIISKYSLSNTFTFISWMINNYFFWSLQLYKFLWILVIKKIWDLLRELNAKLLKWFISFVVIKDYSYFFNLAMNLSSIYDTKDLLCLRCASGVNC